MCQITPSEVAVTVDEDDTHEVHFVSVDGARWLREASNNFNMNVMVLLIICKTCISLLALLFTSIQ
ncbi:hypothetical protein DPMN_147534 [Dreissena polymorpha]|uniref:Uncharacterized protein n=1 Tax=Dreissena polymorpha TaxID=45954 RepID=A0A9D4F820_DREPO|nr:hypothetical protein DPMN_147534 [Dreissena polymorpha]